MPEALEAAELEGAQRAGGLAGCVVRGPLSFDLAFDAEAAARKRLLDAEFGVADVLLFPNLVAANLTVKAIMYTARCRFGGEGEAHFDDIGIALYRLAPGRPMALYHDEAGQQDFLVLHGSCTLIIEGVQRQLHVALGAPSHLLGDLALLGLAQPGVLGLVPFPHSAAGAGEADEHQRRPQAHARPI